MAIFGAAGMVLAAISAATAKETRGMDFGAGVEESTALKKALAG